MGGHGGEDGDEGLGSQGMHTSSYTYHLREGKRAQRGVPGADKEKGVIESEQHSESPGPGSDSLTAHPGTHLSLHCLAGGGQGDENASGGKLPFDM